MGLPKGSGIYYNRSEYVTAYRLATVEHRRKLARKRYKNLNKSDLKKIKDYRRKNQRYYTLWQIRWNKAHPHSIKNIWLKTRYGITLDDYLKMQRKQKGLCAICYKTPKQNGKNLSVDHCHKTGRVRGLLCVDCNTSLGRMKDSPKLLRKAAKYLETL